MCLALAQLRPGTTSSSPHKTREMCPHHPCSSGAEGTEREEFRDTKAQPRSSALV